MGSINQIFARIDADGFIFWFVALTFLLLPTGTAPPLIAVGLALAVWLFSGRFLKAGHILTRSFFWPVIPFLVLPWIGLLYSLDPELGMDYAMKTKYWIVLLVTAGLVLDEQRIRILIHFFWAGLFMGAALALIQFAGFVKPIDHMFLGFGIVHTLISMYLIIGILTASFYFKSAKTKGYKILLIVLMAAFLFHLTVLRGRSGYLMFACFSPFVAANLMYSFSKKIKVALCILMILSLSLSPVVRQTIHTTMTNLEAQKQKIAQGVDVEEFPRFFIIRSAVEQLIAHPFIGIGTGSLAHPTRLEGHEVAHPHNNILYMGVSFGLFGILACLWLFWTLFIRSWKHRATPLGYFIMSICLVLFFGGVFDTHILNTGTLLLLAMGYGLLNCLEPDKPEKIDT
ncbi:MAG: O-antigen ligase family protein [Desulfobacteraceae bacterium]|nr:O-antigen ligase family protein [Desulfobacteraceae bacterium]